MEIDIHGYHPDNILETGIFTKLVQQAWEMENRTFILFTGTVKSGNLSWICKIPILGFSA